MLCVLGFWRPDSLSKMADVFTILTSLEKATGRLEKERILKTHQDRPALKEAFRLALDPAVNFYIKTIPPHSKVAGSASLSWALGALVEDLASRKYTGHAAIKRLTEIFDLLDQGDKEVLKRVIGRNLKCGVSDATVEKIWPDLRLSYPCQLVSPLNSGRVEFPCLAQTKMDGMRFNAHVKDGVVEYRSRNGKEIDLLGALDDDFLALASERPLVYDGELLVYGHDGKPLDRKTGNGLLTKFQKGTGTEQVAKKIRAVLWDAIPMADFWKGKCSVPCVNRLTRLRASIAESRVKRLMNVDTHEIESFEEAQELYQQKLSEGEEGLILKDMDSPWEDKRVKHQVKLKAILSADLRVTGFQPGTGKYDGKIGSLIAESSDGKVRTSVGTGLSDEERSLNFKKEFEGKIIEVNYNALITDKKTKACSLFLPVFVEVRLDKDEPDTL